MEKKKILKQIIFQLQLGLGLIQGVDWVEELLLELLLPVLQRAAGIVTAICLTRKPQTPEKHVGVSNSTDNINQN